MHKTARSPRAARRRVHPLAFVLGASVVSSLLGGCTFAPVGSPASPSASAEPQGRQPSTSPSTSPSPTVPPVPERLPDFNALTVSTKGLGSLRVGEPVSDSDMAYWSPDACLEAWGGRTEGLEPGRWRTSYDSVDGVDPFGVQTTESGGGDVFALDIRSGELATESGIRIGSTLEELQTAHPELVLREAGPISAVYSVSDEHGSIHFEVTNDSWSEISGTVLLMLIVNTNGPAALRAASDNVVGGCF